MDLQQLRFLVAVSKTLNFTKAAEELFISQPTLSHQIRRLEGVGIGSVLAMLGVGRVIALFNRIFPK